MMKLVEHTEKDPFSLNLDLDYFMANYELCVRKILKHINLDISTDEMEYLVKVSYNYYHILLIFQFFNIVMNY